MLTVVASARPDYDPALQTLTAEIPTSAQKGDVLVMIVAHAAASSITVPEDWTDLGTTTETGISIRRVARMLDGTESATLVVELSAAGDEVQGCLLVLRGGGSIPLLVEASGSLAFAATMAPGSPAISSLQAINIALEIWSTSGSPTLTPPTGFDAVDTYSTSLMSARTLLVASKRANATGALTLGAASSDINATGSAFAMIIRDGLPMQPAELVDLVPGNIGLLGKDNRPPRESA